MLLKNIAETCPILKNKLACGILGFDFTPATGLKHSFKCAFVFTEVITSMKTIKATAASVTTERRIKVEKGEANFLEQFILI